MSRLISVAEVASLPAGKSVALSVEGQTLALFNIGGAYYAIDDTCTHAGGNLSEGECEGTIVTCPWHGARFDLATGAVLSPPAREAVRCYPVHVQGQRIHVELP